MHPTVLAVTQSMPVLLMGLAVLAILCSAAVAPSIPELRQKRSALLREAEGIIAKADGEKRDLNDDEEKAVTDRTDEAARILADVERAERRQTLRSTVAAGVAGLSRPLGPKSGETLATAPLGSVQAVEAWRTDPARGYRRAADQLVDVMRFAATGRASAQLESLRAAAGSDEASENASPYGDFLLAPAFQPVLLKVDPEVDPVAGLVTEVPMAVPAVRLPARVDKDHRSSVSGGLQVFRRASSQDVDPKRVKMERIELRADSLMGLSFAEEEILSDSPISFAAILAAGFNDEFRARKLSERLAGTGAGEFLGVLNSPCLVTVAAQDGQEADTFLYENAIDMRSRCWGYGRAIWLYNQDVLPELMRMVIPTGTGGVPAWVTSAREDRPDTFLGRPAYPTEFCKTRGDLGDVILGNWSQYLEGNLEGTQGAESTHVRFDTHERAFKFWQRNAGAPWWRSTLHPKNSEATLSPFVVCAERAGS
ncbi:MAG: phage major capsid protein [Planctomycetes bacterium]|nr:phage major capsid protein [Planctomycetota bacterium]